ncbi:MAG: hypothetical protein FWF25_05545 [Propionibacteriaceae bacterium]|nr:hypothetical protein [Propionibacteriaceae bacterium]
MTGDHTLLNAWAAAHTALLVEGQSRLSQVVGADSSHWEMDPGTGLLTINGSRLQFALLGWVDDETNVWSWAWASPGMDSQAIAVQRALPLQDFGAESGLWEYTAPAFSMEGVLDLGMTPGATVALVASPQLMGGAIFSGVFPGKRVYTVVTDPRLTMDAPTAFTVPTIISGALAYGLGDHRDIVMVYAGAHQLDTEESDQDVTLRFADGSRLKVEFDDDNRVRTVQEVTAGEPAPVSGQV